jgi:hypothetical protein
MAQAPGRRDIPGFIFGKKHLCMYASTAMTNEQIDETRGRYFPVLPRHAAPINYFFTEDAVKQKELKEVSHCLQGTYFSLP